MGFIRLDCMINSGQSTNDCLHSGKGWHVVAIQSTKPYASIVTICHCQVDFLESH